MRGETQWLGSQFTATQFQSTPLMRGETNQSRYSILYKRYFNPLPSCEGRQDPKPISKRNLTFQSTPLMRGETNSAQYVLRSASISIHSPHARGDPMRSCIRPIDRDFNPLPSCEGRRCQSGMKTFGTKHFNPLPSCEGRPCRQRY